MASGSESEGELPLGLRPTDGGEETGGVSLEADGLQGTCIITPDDFVAGYDALKSQAALAGSSILIFVSNDVDSICALHILLALLQADSLQYSVRPVSSYEDLMKHGEEHVKDHLELRAVVMLNCGGSVDLIGTTIPPPHEGLKYYIIDSHRPYHLKNVRNQENFVIFDNSPIQEYPVEEGDWSELNEDEELARQQKRRRLDRPPPAALESYYRMNYFGKPASSILFELAHRLNRATNNTLWLAITALTDFYLHQKMDNSHYLGMLREYRDLVDAALLPGEPKIDYEREEYRFMLYRHWSLYESMYHSCYVAAKLGIWTEGGKKKLQLFLAKMGLPVEDATQRFTCLSLPLKTALREKIMEFAPHYGLDDIVYPSFSRQVDARLRLSAADAVYAIGGLLEAPGEAGGAGADGQWEKNFWDAFDALRSKTASPKPHLQRGISQAIKLQKEIVSQASLMLERRIIVTMGPFRHTFIADYNPVFAHPLALFKLASFLDETQTESRKVQKPFLIGAFNEPKNTYLFIGFVGFGIRGKSKLNAFGAAFRQTAHSAEAHLKQHGFDHAVVEVQRDDMKKFVEYLRLLFLPLSVSHPLYPLPPFTSFSCTLFLCHLTLQGIYSGTCTKVLKSDE